MSLLCRCFNRSCCDCGCPCFVDVSGAVECLLVDVSVVVDVSAKLVVECFRNMLL